MGDIKQVGEITQRVCDLLGVPFVPGTPIFLGPSNVSHMETEHKTDFDKYFPELENIINNPDFLNLHPTNGSIQYIKVLDAHIMVGVRVSLSGKLFARTIFKMTNQKVKIYQEKNLLKKY